MEGFRQSLEGVPDGTGHGHMEERLFKKQPRIPFLIGYVLLTFTFLGLPFLTTYDILVEDIIVWSLFAIGYNLAFGFTGMVSLGHGVFFGVSAFTVGILSLFWQRSIVTIPIGIAVGTATAFIVGYVSLKRARVDVHKALRIAYLVLISIAASYVTMYIFLNPLAKYSGAEMGLLGFPDQPLHVIGNLKVDLKSHHQTFLIVGVVALLMIGWLHRIASSPAGTIMRAIRENEVRVGFLGYNTFRFKLLVYTISGFVASVAGCLYLLRSGFISVDVYDFSFTSELVVICLLGGRNAFFGPMVGAAIFLILKDVISSYTASWALFLALVLILSVLYLPGGVGPMLFSAPKMLRRAWRKNRILLGGTTPPK
jgi:branched-chain amino acid transport system permease protein